MSSLSYEAKAAGVKRGMRLSEIKRLCPERHYSSSDYETYSLLSKRLFDIVRRYTGEVEEYSIDECFADLTGLRRSPQNELYPDGRAHSERFISGIGLYVFHRTGPNKIIAKIGSKWKKPAGLTVIPAKKIHLYLQNFPRKSMGHRFADPSLFE